MTINDRSSPMTAPTLAIVILAVQDLPRALRFYREALGLSPRVETSVYVELSLPGGGGLGLYEREGFGRNMGETPALPPAGTLRPTELYFRCDNLDAAIEAMERAGARPLSARALREWGDEAAYFADPEGNVIVVATPPSHEAG